MLVCLDIWENCSWRVICAVRIDVEKCTKRETVVRSCVSVNVPTYTRFYPVTNSKL